MPIRRISVPVNMNKGIHSVNLPLDLTFLVDLDGNCVPFHVDVTETHDDSSSIHLMLRFNAPPVEQLRLSMNLSCSQKQPVGITVYEHVVGEDKKRHTYNIGQKNEISWHYCRYIISEKQDNDLSLVGCKWTVFGYNSHKLCTIEIAANSFAEVPPMSARDKRAAARRIE